MKKSQLRAISYAVTKREQEKAVSALKENYGIEFETFAKEIGYKGSPCRMEHDIRSGHASAKIMKAAGLKRVSREVVAVWGTYTVTETVRA